MRREIALDAVRLAVLLWVCIHAVLGFSPYPSFSGFSALVVPGLVASLVLLDQRISNEAVFLANVGIRPSVAPLAAAAATLGLELLALMALS